MNRNTRFNLFLALAVIICSAAALATETMPISQIKPGMKGRGRSVFEGNRIEEFNAEILGVLENVQSPGHDLILARLSGHGLENTGIIAGMSGSPVYIDGRLIGAVSYGFAFSKEPICGITPIGEMMSITKNPAPVRSASAEAVVLRSSLSWTDLLEIYRKDIGLPAAVQSSGQTIVPLGVPLYFNGFSPVSFEQAKGFFSALGFKPMLGGAASLGGGGQLDSLKTNPLEALHEGDAVGVQLVRGDLDMTAVGTVTYVDVAQVLAFGHPFYNLGSVEYAMTSANVMAILPNLQSSDKLASTGPVIGTIVQDRTTGVMGELGRTPRMIPLNINLRTGPNDVRSFKLSLVSDKILTPALVNMSVSSLITSALRSFGSLSLEFEGTIYLSRDGANVKIEDLFSGSYDQAATGLSSLTAALVYFLANNDFMDAGIYRIDLNVNAIEEARFGYLDKVLLDKYEVSPGEPIQVKVNYRTFHEDIKSQDVTLVAPPLPAGTEFQLIVGDAATMAQFERAQYRISDFQPRNFNQLIRVLGNMRKNNRIYFKIVAPKPGIFLKGEEMPNLPPSLKAMFLSSRASASSPIELNKSTLGEYQMHVPYVFRGGAVVTLKIKE